MSSNLDLNTNTKNNVYTYSPSYTSANIVLQRKFCYNCYIKFYRLFFLANSRSIIHTRHFKQGSLFRPPTTPPSNLYQFPMGNIFSNVIGPQKCKNLSFFKSKLNIKLTALVLTQQPPRNIGIQCSNSPSFSLFSLTS